MRKTNKPETYAVFMNNLNYVKWIEEECTENTGLGHFTLVI